MSLSPEGADTGNKKSKISWPFTLRYWAKVTMESQTGDHFIKVALPYQAKVLVKEGEKVEAGTVLAKVRREDFIEVDLPSLLRVSSKKVSHCLEVSLGQEVSCGQVLARKKRLFGKKTVISPVAGKAESLSEERGILKLKVLGGEEMILAPVSGYIDKIEREFLTLKFSAQVFVGKMAFGKDAWGELSLFGGEFFSLSLETKGKVLLMDLLTPVLLAKMEALGAAGVVCQSGKVDSYRDLEMGVIVADEEEYKQISDLVGKKVQILVAEKKLIVSK